MMVFIKDIYLALSVIEKQIVVLLLFTIILCSILFWRNSYLANTITAPDFGGVFREGVVANSVSDVQGTINKLTKIGLVSFDKDKNIVPEIATEWNISEDQKTYTFKLKDFAQSSKIAEVIKSEKSDWVDIDIQSPDNSTLVFKLKQVFSPLLANLADPIFPYGPYTITSEDNKGVIFSANNNFWRKKPYISQIELKFYPNIDNLNKALKKRDLDGISQMNEQINLPDNWSIYKMDLPRYTMLFFNLNREVVQDANLRKKLANNESIGKSINLVLVTSDNPDYMAKANEIKNNWLSLGVNIELQIKTTKELQKEIIPSRNYDLLLYGLDYGNDPDPYPFWHSSQTTNVGLNLSNFSDVAADKLLEDARQTNNQETRNNKYQAFEKILDDQKPAIVLNHVKWEYAISNKVVGAIDHQGVTSADRYFGIWDWYIRTQRINK